MIYGNRVDLVVLTFLASMVARIFTCRDARRRGRVVSAARAGESTVAAFAALIGFAQQTPVDTLLREMAAGSLDRRRPHRRGRGPDCCPCSNFLFKRFTTDITRCSS